MSKTVTATKIFKDLEAFMGKTGCG